MDGWMEGWIEGGRREITPPFPPADTTRAPKSAEDHKGFYFVTEEEMRKDIVAHKFIEFGKHQQSLYGVKADSILDVVNSGRMCILDVHPQVCWRGIGGEGSTV